MVWSIDGYRVCITRIRVVRLIKCKVVVVLSWIKVILSALAVSVGIFGDMCVILSILLRSCRTRLPHAIQALLLALIVPLLLIAVEVLILIKVLN